jgi:5'-nucleotidase
MSRSVLLVTFIIAALATPAAASAAPLRILVTNDDGFGAAGISRLVEGLRTLPDVSVMVVAPATDQSGSGDRTSGAASQLQVNLNARTQAGYPAIAVNGYPADSVNYALYRLAQTGQPRPHLVVSGINEGSNPGPLGRALSGTIGAALTASRAGLPALASSQSSGSAPDWGSGVYYTRNWVSANRGSLKTGVVFNMNIPSCAYGTRIAGQKNTSWLLPGLPTSYAALFVPIYCFKTWLPLLAEVDAIANGYVSVSKISS